MQRRGGRGLVAAGVSEVSRSKHTRQSSHLPLEHLRVRSSSPVHSDLKSSDIKLNRGEQVFFPRGGDTMPFAQTEATLRNLVYP